MEFEEQPILYAPLVLTVAQQTFNLPGVGSNPAGRTIS